jgi:hypothetical protein
MFEQPRFDNPFIPQRRGRRLGCARLLVWPSRCSDRGSRFLPNLRAFPKDSESVALGAHGFLNARTSLTETPEAHGASFPAGCSLDAVMPL